MQTEPLKTFDGYDLYPDHLAAHLLHSIQTLLESEQFLVNQHMAFGPHFIVSDPKVDTSTDPFDATALVRLSGCAALATQSARALGAELTKEQALELAMQAQSVYTRVPSLVHAFIHTP